MRDNRKKDHEAQKSGHSRVHASVMQRPENPLGSNPILKTHGSQCQKKSIGYVGMSNTDMPSGDVLLGHGGSQDAVRQRRSQWQSWVMIIKNGLGTVTRDC